MNPTTVDDLRRRLAAQVGLPATGVVREAIRVWRLSGVERLRGNGASVIFKYALPPFTGEHRVLTWVAAQGVPVPEVRAAMTLDGMLGMILHDLGPPVREPTEHDAAAVAAHLHTVTPAPWLDRLGETDLAALPGRALACLDQLRAAGRFANTDDLAGRLHRLDRMAEARAAGAERPPFGQLHGELHPTAVHIGATGRHLLDLAMAFIGSGLLDLAAWPGLRLPANPARTRWLIEQYVHHGGHPDAMTDRGGLPAERWTLGWHRVQAAHWLLDCGAGGIDTPDTDPRHIMVLRRQLTGALDLLAT